MTLPKNTEAFIYKGGSWILPGVDDRECEGAAFHSPRPLFVRPTRLVLEAWWDADHPHPSWAMAPDAWLCGTCRDNLAILLQMLHATDGALDWEIRREYGNLLRALALRGWQWFSEHRPAESPPTPTKG